MQIETSEQAAEAVERVHCFLLGLSVGKAHIGITKMLRATYDVRCFLMAEEKKPGHLPPTNEEEA